MNNFNKATVLAIVLAGGMRISSAITLLGVWHGHVVVDNAKLPKITGVGAKNKRVKMIAQIQAENMNLVITREGTYTLITWGGPVDVPNQSGRWSVSGKYMVLTPYRASKPDGPTTSLAIARDGKSFRKVDSAYTTTFLR